MDKDDLDFSDIQKIFAARDKEKKEESFRREIHSNPEYDNMHVKNIRITPYGKEVAKKKLSLKKKIAIAAVALGLTGALFAGKTILEKADVADPIVYIENNDATESDVYDNNIISIDDCELDKTTIILRTGSDNVEDIIDMTSKELTELGVSVITIDSDDDLLEKISDIKDSDTDEKIFVINVDGSTNRTDTDTVIMTNYSNDFASADSLAIAIQCENESTFGIESVIKCGERTASGRGKTDLEKTLIDAGYDDVACLTIAPTVASVDEEMEKNNYATAIAQGVIRVLSLTEEERDTDYIRRVEFGDTISELAVEYDVSEEYIISKNKDVLESSKILRNDTALFLKKVPEKLTETMQVENPTVTVNPDDITTSVYYYTVKAGDTAFGIAEELDISSSSLIVPSGDIDKINVGDEIKYEKTEGPILISPLESETKTK